MRIVFFGSPSYALPTLTGLLNDPKYEIVAVVTQPDRRRRRGRRTEPTPVKKIALDAGLDILQPERLLRDSSERIGELLPEVGIVAASGHILPQHLLDVFPHDVLNVHGSLLPRHRGASAIASSILHGDEESGASIMKIIPEIDAGPLLIQASTPIEALDTTETLTDRVSTLGSKLLLDILPHWVDGKITASDQDESLATQAPRLSKLDGTINWSLSATEVWRRIRAFQPWPLATTSYLGQPFIVHEAWPIKSTVTAAPGVVVTGDKTPLTPLLPGRHAEVVVSCGNGALALLSVQSPGRRTMSIEHYVNGNRDLIGSRLE